MSSRYWLYAVGVSAYPTLHDAELPDAPRDLALVVDAFEKVGYSRIPVSRDGLNITKAEFDHDLRKWLQSTAHPDDTLALYFVGHGQPNRQTNDHYLHFTDSDEDDLSTAYQTANLLNYVVRKRVDNSVHYPVRRAVFIVDCCYSGEGVRQIAARAHGYLEQREPPNLILIPSTRPNKTAKPLAFSSAWAYAIDEVLKSADPTEPFLALDAIMNAVRQHLVGTPQFPYWEPAAGVHGPLESILQFFPNPRFDHRVPTGLDLDSRARYKSDLLEHWVPRAKGGESIADAWYFTGRSAVLQTLVEWLRQPGSDGRCRLVTGGPGTGKSAILGRLVTLSDAEWRQKAESEGALSGIDPATLPPVGVLNSVLLARKRTLRTLAMTLAEDLGNVEIVMSLREAQRPEEVGAEVHRLVEWIRLREGALAVVVDALDESLDAGRIAEQLLRPLSAMLHVRVLVGSRPSGPASRGGAAVPQLGTAVEVIDLDRSTSAGEIAEYVSRRLLAADDRTRFTPYRDLPHLVPPIAAAVARQAAGVFLIAKIVASSLLQRPGPVGPDQHHFPSEVDKAFDEYIDTLAERPHAPSKERIWQLLAPFAFAEGEGIGGDYLLDALATAISGKPAEPAETEWIFTHAGAFIVQTLVADRSVYRLYHEELARYVRSRAGVTDEEITRTLLASVPADAAGPRRWSNAHPYVLRHIVRHAVRGLMLDELLNDPAFLATAEPVSLVPFLSLASANEAQEAADVYLLVSHRLAGMGFGERLSQLELTARQLAYDDLAKRFAAVSAARAWQPTWTDWDSVNPHRQLNAPPSYWQHLLVESLAGRRHLIGAFEAPGSDGSVLMWDLNAGDAEPIRVASGVQSRAGIGMLHHDDAPILVAGHGSTLRLFDLRTRTELEPLRVPDSVGMSCCAAVDLSSGNSYIVIGESTGDVAVYDYGSRQLVTRWEIEEGVEIKQVRCADVDGKLVIIARAGRGRIILDAASETSTIVNLQATENPSSRISIVRRPDSIVAVIADYEEADGYELHTGKLVFSYTLPSMIETATTVTVAEQSLLACSDLFGGISFYDLASGKRAGTLAGALGSIEQMLAFADRDRTFLMTADSRKSIKIWELAAGRLEAAASSRHNVNESASPGALDDLIVVGRYSRIEARRGSDGAVLWERPTRSFFFRSLSACRGPEGLTVAGWDEGIEVARFLADGQAQATEKVPLVSDEWSPKILCIARPEGTTVVAEPKRGELHACRVLRPWWARLLDWVVRRPAITVGKVDAANGRLTLTTAVLDGRFYVVACTATHVNFLEPDTLQVVRKFALPNYAFTARVAVVDVEGRSKVVRSSGDAVHLHDPDSGELTTMPWELDDLGALAVLKPEAPSIWVTGSSLGLLQLWTPARTQPLTTIDLGASVRKLYAFPAEHAVVAHTTHGLIGVRFQSSDW